MKIDKLPADELASNASNVMTLLGGTELSAIDSNVRTDLLTLFGTMPTELNSLLDQIVVVKDQLAALIAEKDGMVDTLILPMRQTRDALKSGMAPAEQFALCGFDYPFGPKGVVTAQAPSDLSLMPYSGFNEGKFKGHNESGQVIYQLWRREGDEGPWGIHLTLSKQNFRDTSVVAGQYYEYKVRAVATSNESAFSNTFVCYGAK